MWEKGPKHWNVIRKRGKQHAVSLSQESPPFNGTQPWVEILQTFFKSGTYDDYYSKAPKSLVNGLWAQLVEKVWEKKKFNNLQLQLGWSVSKTNYPLWQTFSSYFKCLRKIERVKVSTTINGNFIQHILIKIRATFPKYIVNPSWSWNHCFWEM